MQATFRTFISLEFQFEVDISLIKLDSNNLKRNKFFHLGNLELTKTNSHFESES